MGGKYSIQVRNTKDDYWVYINYNINWLIHLLYLWIKYSKYEIIEIHVVK